MSHSITQKNIEPVTQNNINEDPHTTALKMPLSRFSNDAQGGVEYDRVGLID